MFKVNVREKRFNILIYTTLINSVLFVCKLKPTEKTARTVAYDHFSHAKSSFQLFPGTRKASVQF